MIVYFQISNPANYNIVLVIMKRSFRCISWFGSIPNHDWRFYEKHLGVKYKYITNSSVTLFAFYINERRFGEMTIRVWCIDDSKTLRLCHLYGDYEDIKRIPSLVW